MVVPDFSKHGTVVGASKVGEGAHLPLYGVLNRRQRVRGFIRRGDASSARESEQTVGADRA